jgi:hypothetical protein
MAHSCKATGHCARLKSDVGRSCWAHLELASVTTLAWHAACGLGRVGAWLLTGKAFQQGADILRFAIGVCCQSRCRKVAPEIIRKLRFNDVTLHWIPGLGGWWMKPTSSRRRRRVQTARRYRCEKASCGISQPMRLKGEYDNGTALVRESKHGKFTREIDAVLHPGKAAGLYYSSR